MLTRHTMLAITLLWLLGGTSCDEGGATEVRVDLLFPAGENPLAETETLQVDLLAEGTRESLATILRPESGYWSDLDMGISLGAASLSLAQIELLGLGADGTPTCAGRSIPVSLEVGRPGQIKVLIQRYATAALAPSLPEGLEGHAGAYLDGGGVLLVGGAAELSERAVVYSLDLYETVAVADVPEPIGAARAVSLNGSQVLVFGELAQGISAHVYDVTTNSWQDVPLPVTGPELGALTRIDGGLAVALIGSTLVGIEPTAPYEASVIVSGDAQWEGATLTPLGSSELLLVGGSTDAAAVVHVSEGTLSVAAPPLGGQRSGHGAVALDDGRVLVAGGQWSDTAVAVVEAYDGESDQWTAVAELSPDHLRTEGTLTLLSEGRVLLAGGATVSSSEDIPSLVIDVLDGAMVEVSTAPRRGHVAVPLPWGPAILCGGYASGATLDSVEVVLPPYEG